MLNFNSWRRRWPLAPVAIIVFCLSLIFAGQAWLESSSYYSDIPSKSYYNVRSTKVVFDSVNRLYDLGVFEDTDCGQKKFCPDNSVDRKTFAVWVVRVVDGDSAPDFIEGGQSFETRFDDVAEILPEARFIERLAELGTISGCSTNPNLYCPDDTISRAEIADFIVGLLDLPKSELIGFWDVDKNSKYLNDIDSLVGSEIDSGCSEIRFVPLNFCPEQQVSRGGMARLLSEVVDYIEAKEIIKVTPGSGVDNSIDLNVGYNESSKVTAITWGNPSSSRGSVSHFVLQWRPTWTGFNYQRYQVVEFSGSGNYKTEFADAGNNLYSVRVLVKYKNGDSVATSEIKVPSESYSLRDAIERQMIDAHARTQPWLVDVWRHLNSNSYSRLITTHLTTRYDIVRTSSVHSEHNLQIFTETVSLGFSGDNLYGEESITAHEFGHAYTLTSGITKNEAPIAIGHIYLGLLNSKHASGASAPRDCTATELYADLAKIAFFGAQSDFDPRFGIPILVSIEKYNGQLNGTYWQRCGFNLDQKTSDDIAEDIEDMTESIFLDQEMPQWFYDRYQSSDGPVDLDKLWSDVSGITNGRTRALVVYGLQNEFGGYCSNEEVGKFVRGKVRRIETPWRDSGGCSTTDDDHDERQNQPEEEDQEPSGSETTTDCSGNIPIVVASDEASQSDRYSAATLAGVLGTDCIVLAGGRKEPMPADQRARLDSATFPGYIVGGTAAVPNSKFIGHPNSNSYTLKRLSGTDRWHTARLVGAEAVIVAGGSNAAENIKASIGAENPTTDCSGNIPIVVASDEASQSDRYSAATLAGVLGTDCIVLAGGRKEPMPADQRARLDSATFPGYIVGGTAAVPKPKMTGYDLKRLSGTDRWHTARLVGAEAVIVSQ